MRRRISFKWRILFTFTVIVAVFTAGIILFEQERFRRERSRGLERTLGNNADIVCRYLDGEGADLESDPKGLDGLVRCMSPEVRFTVIGRGGRVLYDSRLEAEGMENHLERPEIRKADACGTGTDIRPSISDGVRYLYYARRYDRGYFVRLAIPYDVKLRTFINSGNPSVCYILLFFAACVLMMRYFSGRFSQSLRALREFSLKMASGAEIPDGFTFADDEVGDVSAGIVENYNLLQENRRRLAAEREKLLQHFQLSEEGIALFSADRREIYANTHFLQFLNVILESPARETGRLFEDPALREFVTFIDARTEAGSLFTKRIAKSGRQFAVRLILFEDGSFEFYVSDVTKSEKMRLLKQEMTNNIAHELRTPVTTIRGYLETVLSRDRGDFSALHRGFLDRAYAQTVRLSELIQDISLLTKIEEAPDRFEREPVRIKSLLNELADDLADRLRQTDDRFAVEVSDRVVISGSRTLLYSLFRNLIENAIIHAGAGVEITVRCYSESEESFFFEFYDTGTGVEERHLVRLFERFYRADAGRTRKTGGSGLGLSIVKNAVLFHRGNVVARNRPGGGLHFLMTFPKTGRLTPAGE
ncbi:MAG: HAMP domain-containing histidine kinase [Proteiniphilum sp.]|jgi:two-component system OmpR family sensor kinase/two-component system phosphate regulon sensor histidine kinase PhoR|nr:HAMP domain-containing histidine kinase [Proteiniphilum sp.]